MNMLLPKGICFMINIDFIGIMKKILSVIALMLLFITGCETQGDKFPPFKVKVTFLGKIKDHSIRKAFFINEQTGFAAISKDTILKTTDGWKTFTKSLTDRAATFECIQFVNEKVGFVLDRNKNIFKTLDGGTSWEKTRIDIQEANLLDIKCLNKDTVFIAAGGNPESKTGYIIRSIDGGKTWDITTTKDLSCICFIDESTGFACGKDGIIKTADCGLNWETISPLSANDIMFIDGNTGYVANKRSLFKTIDSGRNWKLLKTIINPHWIMGEDFSKIECLNIINKKDLIFTLNSRLIKVTSDQKWFQYEFTRPYYQLQMIGPETGIVYGFENLILVNF